MKTTAIILTILLSTSCNSNPQETVIKNKKMRTAIVYASSHGTTEKVANLIREKLDSSTVEIFNLKKKPIIDLSNYENIIIGGSIHAGSIQSEVKKFIKDHTVSLMEMRVALYLCCMNEPQEKEEFNTNYPELLRNHSVYNAIVGGEYIFEKMNFIERFLVRKISGVSVTTSKLRPIEIENLVNAINNEKRN